MQLGKQIALPGGLGFHEGVVALIKKVAHVLLGLLTGEEQLSSPGSICSAVVELEKVAGHVSGDASGNVFFVAHIFLILIFNN